MSNWWLGFIAGAQVSLMGAVAFLEVRDWFAERRQTRVTTPGMTTDPQPAPGPD